MVARTVADPKPTMFVEARAAIEKAGVRARLKKLAFLRTHNDADAEDLVQQALARVFDPNGSPWDPKGKVSFFLHTGSVINSIASTGRVSARARREVLDEGLARNEETVDGAPLADAALEVHESGWSCDGVESGCSPASATGIPWPWRSSSPRVKAAMISRHRRSCPPS